MSVVKVEDFLKSAEEPEAEVSAAETAIEEDCGVGNEEEFENLDVQKAVVESLAADKAELDEKINSLDSENLKLKEENSKLQEELNAAKARIEELKAELDRSGDFLAANSETDLANKIALIDREFELPDRFPGETREQVLEVVKEARDRAEEEGRIRKAQILEAVLVANEPTGELSAKREALEKFFAENHNILTGTVIAELERCDISYKHGEEYLLPAEIIKRTY